MCNPSLRDGCVQGCHCEDPALAGDEAIPSKMLRIASLHSIPLAMTGRLSFRTQLYRAEKIGANQKIFTPKGQLKMDFPGGNICCNKFHSIPSGRVNVGVGIPFPQMEFVSEVHSVPNGTGYVVLE